MVRYGYARNKKEKDLLEADVPPLAALHGEAGDCLPVRRGFPPAYSTPRVYVEDLLSVKEGGCPMDGPAGTKIWRFGRCTGRCGVCFPLTPRLILAWGCGYWGLREALPVALATREDMIAKGGALRYWGLWLYFLLPAALRGGLLVPGRWLRYHPLHQSALMRSKRFEDEVCEWLVSKWGPDSCGKI